MNDWQIYLQNALNEIDIEESDIQQPAFMDYDIKKDIKELLVNTRHKANISQKEIANKTGIELTDIKNIENGSLLPNIDDLKKIATALNKKLIISFEDFDTEAADL